MIKLVVVNVAFRLPALYKRWRLLQENNPDLDITLVGPEFSESTRYGEKIEYVPEKIEEKNFRVVHINMKQPKWFKVAGLNGWMSMDLWNLLKNNKPDMIYLIGLEENIASLQVGIARKLYTSNAKIACFTMRGYGYSFSSINPIRSLFKFSLFHITNKIFDVMLCHYPQSRSLIIEQRKFNKPVYMQTQIGVDKDIFKPNLSNRQKIREKYKIKNEFVFGSVGSIYEAKGVFDIIEALPKTGNWKFLMIGGGRDYDKVKDLVHSKGLQGKVVLPGYVPAGEEVAAHLNAMDCFVHFPKTKKRHVDSFPGVVPEAMATALPIIGSDSGAVPYQLGEKGVIVSEGNILELQKAMLKMMQNPYEAKAMGQSLYKRVITTFEIRHLSQSFNVVMREILSDQFDERNIDQTKMNFEN